jgi:hypothetical protein
MEPEVMGKKKGFSEARQKEPSTLDWDAVRRRNAERLDDEILRGVDDPMTRRRLRDRERAAQGLAPIAKVTPPPRSTPKPRKQTKGNDKEGPGKRLRPDQVADIIEKYTQHNIKPYDIADEMGLSNKTVIDRLRRAGVYDPDKHRVPNTGPATAARWAQTTQPKGEYL